VRQKKILRPADGEVEVLAPAFVALSDDQAERAVRALAELLVAAAERAGGASS